LVINFTFFNIILPFDHLYFQTQCQAFGLKQTSSIVLRGKLTYSSIPALQVSTNTWDKQSNEVWSMAIIHLYPKTSC